MTIYKTNQNKTTKRNAVAVSFLAVQQQIVNSVDAKQFW